MKKFVTVLSVLLLGLCIVGCSKEPPHTHNWATTYSYNNEYHYYVCQNGCNEHTGNETHSYSTQTTPASCHEEGEIKYTCICGKTYTETISVDESKHEMEHLSTVPSTCTTPGKTITKCKHCPKTEETPLALDPTNHDYDEGHITVYSTLTSKGVMTFTCQECYDEKTVDLAISQLAVERMYFDVTDGAFTLVMLDQYGISYELDLSSYTDCFTDNLDGTYTINLEADQIAITNEFQDEIANQISDLNQLSNSFNKY